MHIKIDGEILTQDSLKMDDHTFLFIYIYIYIYIYYVAT